MNSSTSGDSPRLIGIVLCERVLQDVLRRDAVSCINIYNGITAQSFPAVVPLVFAFAQVSSSGTGFEYQFKINDDRSNPIAMSPPARVEPLPNAYLTHKIISAFSGLTFDREGTYEIVLDIGGARVGSLPFQVVLLPQQPMVPEQQQQREAHH